MITGEEKIVPKNCTHVSSTIEMLDISRDYDLAIIDEVQMLDDPQRGSAWTRAILGVKAETVILIGSIDAEDTIKKLVKLCNDELEINYTKRLNTLIFQKSISYNDLKSGDAIICFSRKDVYKFEEICKSKGFSTALIYGNLPPITRLKQAKLFNEGHKDILIATDAIGMGLNLNIKRIIFSSFTKYNGTIIKKLDNNLFKQIAGRAGRYKKNDKGYVTHFSKRYSKIYKRYINTYTKTINSCRFFPEFEHLEKFAKNFDNNNLSFLILEYSKYFVSKNNLFVMSNIDNFYRNAILIDKYKNIPLNEKYKLAFAPTTDENIDIFINFLNGTNMKFSKIPGVLNKLEIFCKKLSLYMWLSNRYLDEDILELYKKYEEASLRINGILKSKYRFL